MSDETEQIKCIHCGAVIDPDEELEFKADTEVTATGTLSQFEDCGVEYDPGDTYNDKVKCPKCGEWTPTSGDSEDLEQPTLDTLYPKLRALIDPKFKIEIRDGEDPEVVIVSDHYNQRQPWTDFRGFTIEDALTRAIEKMSHPERDYRAKPNSISPQGTLWEASGDSVYGEQYTRLFLKTETPTQKA